MNKNCIAAVEAHLSTVHGKPVKLTEAAVKRIDDRMREGAKVLANRDRARWQGMSPEDRTIAIGKWVREQEQIQADSVARSKIRQLSAISDSAKRMNEFAAARKEKPGKWGRSVIDVLEGVDNAMRGAELVALRGFGDMLKEVKIGAWTGDFATRRSDAFFADVVKEIYGTSTGRAEAKKFADQWSATMDNFREARNRAGGTVGKLEHYAPQVHDITVMQRVGQENWVNFMMQNVDRNKYLDDAGNVLDDAALNTVVNKMYTTLVTDGVNKIRIDDTGLAQAAPGGGTANLARMYNSQHREIHLKDADAVTAYNTQFSDRSLGATFFDHMTNNAREMAMVNELGPNPDLTFATLRDTALKRDSEMPGVKFDRDGTVQGSRRAGFNPDAYYRHLAKNNAEFTTVEAISTALLAYQAATKLTSTAMRAPFQDTPGILLNMSDVGQLKNFGSIMRSAFNPKEAGRFGIGAEVALQAAKDGSDRILSQGRLFPGNTMSRYAQATMKYTGLIAWTNAARRAGQTSHALALGEWSNKAWSSLDDSQRALLNNAGIVAEDWTHIQQVPRQQLRGNDIHDVADVTALGLDADATTRLQSKMMGFIRMGGDIVTSEHNITAQTVMSMGGRTNALTKQMLLFKSAVGIQTAHMLDRLSRKQGSTKLGYIGATMSLSVGFGYMALVAQAVTAGQNPPPINDWRTIGKAMGVAGGFAMVQDMITSMFSNISGDNAGHSTSAVPVFGDIYNLGKIGFTAAAGDTSKAGYMAIKFGRQQMAPLNYWYTKAAIDHLFFNDAAEALNPGYQKRLRKYADQKGQQYFYDPSGTGGASFGFGEYTKEIGEK